MSNWTKPFLYILSHFAILSIVCVLPASVHADSSKLDEPVVSHITLTAEQLVAHSTKGSLSSHGNFVLDSNTQADFIINAPHNFRSVGCWWVGDLNTASHSHTILQIIHSDGTETQPYPIIELDDLAPDLVGATGFAGNAKVSNLIHTYNQTANSIRITLQGPIQLESLSIVFIDVPDQPQKPVHADSFVWNDQINIPHNAIRSDDDKQQIQAYPKPSVNSRSSWGADPWQCTPWYCDTTHIGIHHTASASEYNSTGWSQCAANVKATQAYHMYTRGWCDIGYNYLICVHGQIWEGRGGGDNVGGAHDGYNCGSMGVSYMGYFHHPYNQTLNAHMIDAMAELGAWKCDQQNIDPFGSAWYSGYGGTMQTIYGHRDVSSTACPGDLAYNELNTIRAEIDDRLQGGGSTDIILDNPQATFIQDWATSSSGSQTYGNDYRWRSTGIDIGYAYWTVVIPESGTYDLSFWWTASGNRNPQTTVGVQLGGQSYTTTVNQQSNGGQWNNVGSGYFAQGTVLLVGISNQGPGGYVVIADAVRLTKR